MGFHDLALDPDVLRAIEEAGYTEPTPIQAQAIPEVLKARDVLGIAQTGTGKTASFTLPMLTTLARGRARARMPRSIIVEPTRELAAQVADAFETYGKHLKLSMALLIGGVSFSEQEKKLDRGVDVLIATPGRLLDHHERGKVLLSGVQILVIDEADRMLDMGFIPDVERICQATPFTRQTLLFSATMPPEIQRLTEQFQQAPVRIEVAPPASPAATVAQTLIETTPRGKAGALRRLLDGADVKNAIIFCNRKRDVSAVKESLAKRGYDVAALHGDLDQRTRMEVLGRFKTGDVKYLVASDVAARGLDIAEMSHVFNYDVPIHAEDYIHRIGRTGRAGREGTAFTLAAPADDKYVAAIEALIGREIARVDGAPKRARAAKEADPDEAGAEPKPRRGRKSTTAGEAEPRAEEADAKPRRGRRGGAKSQTAARDETEDAPKDRSEGKSEAKRGGRGRGRAPIIGFGDHTPAFMLIRARPADGAESAQAEAV